MTPFNALVSMAILTLRTRGEWQRSATSHEEIDRAVNQCADLLRGDDMPDLITLVHIEAAIIEIKLRCGWMEGDVIHCCAGVGYGNSPNLKAFPVRQ
jgi:hypothetical protein